MPVGSYPVDSAGPQRPSVFGCNLGFIHSQGSFCKHRVETPEGLPASPPGRATPSELSTDLARLAAYLTSCDGRSSRDCLFQSRLIHLNDLSWILSTLSHTPPRHGPRGLSGTGRYRAALTPSGTLSHPQVIESVRRGERRLERAIGVVYMPATERRSHYFEARMSKQFDAVIHLDVTTAVTPLK